MQFPASGNGSSNKAVEGASQRCLTEMPQAVTPLS